VVALGELYRRIKLLGGNVKDAAEQVDPAQHGQSVSLPTGLSGRLGQLDGLLQQAAGPLVIGAVAFHRA
jgi:hypothetical protein